MSIIALRRLFKFLHSLAAAGLTGAIVALAVVVILAPASIGTPGYVPIMTAMANVAGWVIAPSLVLTVATGLLSMVANPAFYEAGWVWAKAATGVVLLEGGLRVIGPLQDEAKRAGAALAGGPNAGELTRLLTSEANTLWLLLAVSIANIALAVWRPRLMKLPV